VNRLRWYVGLTALCVTGTTLAPVGFANTGTVTSVASGSMAWKQEVQAAREQLQQLEAARKDLNQQIRAAVKNFQKAHRAMAKLRSALQTDREQIQSLRTQVKTDRQQLRADRTAKDPAHIKADLEKEISDLSKLVDAKRKLLHDLNTATMATTGP
jgi:chromosome segregation ATPase